jgi:hypothetical protein
MCQQSKAHRSVKCWLKVCCIIWQRELCFFVLASSQGPFLYKPGAQPSENMFLGWNEQMSWQDQAQVTSAVSGLSRVDHEAKELSCSASLKLQR